MLKQLFHLVILSAIFFLGSCRKENVCNEVGAFPTSAEIDSLRTYLADNNIDAIEDPRGFFYEVNHKEESQYKPGICADILVNFTGYVLNEENEVYASGVSVVYDLNTRNAVSSSSSSSSQNVQLPVGLRYGVPMMSKGATYTFYFPPTLGYGVAGLNSTVDPDEMVMIKVKLLSFN